MKKIFTFLMVALFSATMFADNQYWIAGKNGNLGDWGSTYAMTVSADGLYEYFAVKSGDTNCKIYTSADWEGVMGNAYKVMGFNNTNIGSCVGGTWDDGGEEPKNINFWYNDGNYYVIVYKPGTAINATENPIVCASTFLPEGEVTSDIYTVAGVEALCGSTWDPYDNKNNMSQTEEGVFGITYEGLELAATTYEFKVVKNHAWGCGNWPDGNYKLNITESGTYDVTITFTVEGSEVKANAELKEAGEVLPTIQLGGDWTSWAAGAAFEEAEDKKSASTTIHFDEGGVGYGFKVIINGVWLGLPKDEQGGSYTFHRGHTSASGWAEETTDNGYAAAYIWIDKAGDYTFTWTFETGTFAIAYPELEAYAVKIIDTENVTLGVSEGETPIGASVVEFTELTISALVKEGYRVKSLRAYKEGDETVEVAINEGKLFMPSFDLVIKAEEAEHVADGFYLAGDFAGVPAWGIDDLTADKKFVVNPENDAEYLLENVTLAVDDSIKVANVVDDVIKWYAPDAANYVVDSKHAGVKTVYFRPNGDGDESWWYNCIYIPENDPTGVDNTEATVKAVKSIENGMIIIEKNGVRYTVLGQAIK